MRKGKAVARSMSDIFAPGFKAEPWWWRAAPPLDEPAGDLPKEAEIVVVGSGYAGTCCALRLAEAGRDVLVLDADPIGFNASSRSGGQVTGGVNVGKSLTYRPVSDERRAALLSDACKGLALFESLIARHGIDCDYHAKGRLVGFWTPLHAESWGKRIEELNRVAGSQARLVGREEARAALGSDFYWGGVMIERAGHIHPARYHAGLVRAARTAGAAFRGRTRVLSVAKTGGGFTVQTERGSIAARQVVMATNAYTGAHAYGLAPDLRRGVIPVATQMIATEELPEDLAARILPSDRGVSESRRVIAHYRKSPDGRRLLFGGRATFFPLSTTRTATLLYRAMIRRFPELAAIRIENAWGGKVAMTMDRLPHIGGGEGRYFVAGCQGSGITMMSYLGDSLAEKILSADDRTPVNAYDTGLPPHHPLYDGTSWFMPAIGSWYQIQDRFERRPTA